MLYKLGKLYLICQVWSAKELANYNNDSLLDGTGLTPLHYAAREGHTALVDLLLSLRADINAIDHNGRTGENLLKLSLIAL